MLLRVVASLNTMKNIKNAATNALQISILSGNPSNIIENILYLLYVWIYNKIELLIITVAISALQLKCFPLPISLMVILEKCMKNT